MSKPLTHGSRTSYAAAVSGPLRPWVMRKGQFAATLPRALG